MAVNQNPIFPKTPKIGTATLLSQTGTATNAANAALCFSADAYGARVDRLRFVSIGTNAELGIYIYLNNGGDIATAINNKLYHYLAFGDTIAGEVSVETVDIALPPNYRLFAALSATTTGGFDMFVEGGDY